MGHVGIDLGGNEQTVGTKLGADDPESVKSFMAAGW
jgi:hypothetical protein